MDQRKLRHLSDIRRFNFHRCNRYESVAEHTLMVAFLTMDLAEMVWPKSAQMYGTALEAALFHDAHEAVTGDIPFLVKRFIADKSEQHGFNPLSRAEEEAEYELGINTSPFEVGDGSARLCRELVDLADKLELLMYLDEEVRSGNLSLRDIHRETHKLVHTHPAYMRWETIVAPFVERCIGSSVQVQDWKDLPEEMSHR